MKRIITYVLFSIIFLYMGLSKSSDMVYFEFINLPFKLIGEGLRYLSLTSSFLNVIAVFLYILIGLLPVYFLGYKLYKNQYDHKDLLLLSLSVILFVVLNYAINPHHMIDHIYPEILENLTATDYENITSIYLTGITSTFYALLGIYLIITYMKETNLEIKKMLMILVDIFVILLLSGLFMTTIPEIINSIKTTSTDYSNSILLLSVIKTLVSYTIIGFIIHYTFRTIYSFDLENNSLSTDINQLYKFTYIYILVALGFIVFENGIIFLLRDLTDETNFVMDIPLLTMIFAGLLLLISKYIKESNLIKEDNELII